MDTTKTSTALPYLVPMELASSRYLAALEGLDDGAARGASRLPGWTRGHVVTHLSRNADALVNLLHWAETGTERYMYESREQRDRDIEDGAGRPAVELREDAAASAGRLLQAVNELDTRHQDVLVARAPGGETFPARDIAVIRLLELEIHHADLDLGYSHESWDPAFARLVLDQVVDDRADGPAMVLRATDVTGLWRYGVEGQGPEIRGRACDLAWWVLGRGDGARLTCDAGVLPTLGTWR